MNDDELSTGGVLRAPRELVWRCLTEPRELAQFWGPSGMATPIDGITVELHPGGRFETLMVGENGSYRMVATFTDVVPPERLAWVEPASGMHTTSTLDRPRRRRNGSRRSINGACRPRCACPRPAPASSPRSTSWSSTWLTSCKETRRDRPAVLGVADLRPARRPP